MRGKRMVALAAVVAGLWTAAAAKEGDDLVDRLAHDLVCRCGACNGRTLAECPCAAAARDRDWLKSQLSHESLSTPEARADAYQRVRAEFLARPSSLQRGPWVSTRSMYLALVAAILASSALLIVFPKRPRRKGRRRGRA